jgi:Bax protein
MALTMKIGNQAVMAAALAVVCAGQVFVGPTLSGPSSAAAKMVRNTAFGVSEINLFAAPAFHPAISAIASMPALEMPHLGQSKDTPLQLASLAVLPGQRLDWRHGRRFNSQELLDLSLTALRRGKAAVPPVYLSRFPAKLAKLRSPKLRKEIFIKTVLPLVLRANEEVQAERQRMLSLLVRKRAQDNLSASEKAFLAHLAAQYEVPKGDLDELQQRVDVIPASLALAQGAEESGWGTSRFARQGNAVFGQRTFRKGDGLVPLRRAQGQSYEVKAFNSLYTSVRSYVWNLNTHFAYKTLRSKRAALRDGGKPLNGYALTGALERYSERGEKYVQTIRVIMRANRLHDFDDVRLLPADTDLGSGQPS